MATFIEVNKLEGILASEHKNDAIKARELDDSTSIVHRYVWLFRNERRYVLEIVVPLFEKAIGVLHQTKEKGENKNYIDDIAETIGLRRRNLVKNYLNGKDSDYIPVEQLKQVG